MITWLVYVCLGWWGTFEFNWDTQRGLWLGIQGHKHGIVQQFKGRNENVVHHNNTVLFKNSCSKKSARIQLPRAQGYWKVLCPTSNTTHWTPLSWGNASTWPRIQSQRTVVMMRRVSRLNLLYQVSYCNNLKTVPGHWRSKDSKPQQIMTSKSWEGGWFVEFVFHLIHEHWRAAKRSLGRKKINPLQNGTASHDLVKDEIVDLYSTSFSLAQQSGRIQAPFPSFSRNPSRMIRLNSCGSSFLHSQPEWDTPSDSSCTSYIILQSYIILPFHLGLGHADRLNAQSSESTGDEARGLECGECDEASPLRLATSDTFQNTSE